MYAPRAGVSTDLEVKFNLMIAAVIGHKGVLTF